METNNKSNKPKADVPPSEELSSPDTEESFYYALNHEIRRNILRLIGENGKGSFTQFKRSLDISTGTFRSICVAMPGEKTLYEILSKIKDKKRREEANIEILSDPRPFLYEFVDSQKKEAIERFSQLKKYPVTHYSQDLLERYEKASQEYAQLTGNDVLSYAEHHPVFFDMLLPGDFIWSEYTTIIKNNKDDKTEIHGVFKKHDIRVTHYLSSTIPDLLRKIKEDKKLLSERKIDPWGDDERKSELYSIKTFLAAIPLNRFTKCAQEMLYEAAKKEEEAIDELINKEKTFNLFFLFRSHKQRKKVDELIKKKQEIDKGGILTVGQKELDYEKSVETFGDFILELRI